ncbi:MAG: hypothetical protein HY320_07850 [Armatimonadetes bacterium]|nr:hypothetical protein [Armatimonadota bacterium]
MARLIWSAQAAVVREALPEAERTALERRLDYLRRMPRMYQMAADERFPGCRSFWLAPTYRVFYMVGASSDDVYLAAILEEEVDRVEP